MRSFIVVESRQSYGAIIAQGLSVYIVIWLQNQNPGHPWGGAKQFYFQLLTPFLCVPSSRSRNITKLYQRFFYPIKIGQKLVENWGVQYKLTWKLKNWVKSNVSFPRLSTSTREKLWPNYPLKKNVDGIFNKILLYFLDPVWKVWKYFTNL